MSVGPANSAQNPSEAILNSRLLSPFLKYWWSPHTPFCLRNRFTYCNNANSCMHKSTVEEPRVSAAIPKREREKVFSRGSLPQSSLTLAPPSDLDSAPVLGGSGLRPALTLAPTPEAPLLFFLLVFLLLLRCSRLPYRLACFSVFEAFLEAPSLERSSVSGVSPLVMDLRRDGFWRHCRRSRRFRVLEAVP